MPAVIRRVFARARRPMRQSSARGGALLAAVAVFALAWALSGGNTRAATDYMTLTGDDVYHTSVLLSMSGFAPGVGGVVVANGDDYMAATSSAVLAAAHAGPVLLTPADSLDPRVLAELKRLGPGLIFVVGTDAAVAAGIAGAFPAVAAAGRVVMLRGADGPETAGLVAAQMVIQGAGGGGVVLVSSDQDSAPRGCAVAASGLAAAKGWPLLFVPTRGKLSGVIADVVGTLEPKTVVKVQTSAEVGVVAEVVSLEGDDRYQVGARIAEYASSVGLSFAHTVVVGGSDELSTQGFAVGAYLARNKGVAVMCAAEDIPAETIGLLLGRAGEIKRLDFCGPLARARDRVNAVVEAKGTLPKGFGTLAATRGSRGPAVAWLEQRLSELSYRPGSIDGKFDHRTKQALIAFQKWEGMKRDGVAGSEVWWRLLGAGRPVPQMVAPGTWIEVDKKRQLLLLCVDGAVERTLSVSTGNARIGIVTPSGVFHITRENTRERYRYKPLYLRNFGYLAIHGYTNVPAVAASHGCVRTTWADMDELHALVPVGTAVYIY